MRPMSGSSVRNGFYTATSHRVPWSLMGAAVVFLVLGALLPRLPVTQLTVRTTVETAEPTTMAVYVNQLDSPLDTISLPADVKTSDNITIPPGGIHLIQLNFYGPVGETIFFSSVQIRNGHRLLSVSSAAHFTGWQMSYVQPVVGQPGAPQDKFVVLKTTEQTSAMRETPSISSPGSFPGAAATRDPLERLAIAFWTGLILAVVSWAITKHRRGLLALIITAAVVSVGCLFLLVKHSGGLTSASKAVGRATYLGLSVATNVHAIEAMYLLAVILGLGIGLGSQRLGEVARWGRRRLKPRSRYRRKGPPYAYRNTYRARAQGRRSRRRAPSAIRGAPRSASCAANSSGSLTAISNREVTVVDPERDGRVPRRLRDGLFAGTALLAALAVFTPDILSDLRAAAAQVYVPAFDSTNNLAWQIFDERGLVPMRNFWYPYGNSLFLSAHPIVGPALDMCINLSECCAFGWVFWRLSSGNRWATWLGVIGLILSEQFLPEFSRYSVGYLVPLLYWSIPPGPRRQWPGRAALALAVGGGLFLEPDPIVYGLLGLALTLLVELVVDFHRVGQLMREVATNLAVPVALGILYLIYTTLQGQMGGLWDVFGQPSVLAAYSAFPTVLVTGFTSILGINGLVIWVPAVLLAAGAYLRAKSDGADTIVARFLIGLSGCGFLLLEKDAVRPIPDQIRTTIFLAAIVLLVASSAAAPVAVNTRLRFGRRISTLALGGCVGAVVAAVAAFPGLGVLRSGLEHLGGTVGDDIHVVFHPSEARRLEQSAIEPARFTDYATELQIAKAIKGFLGSSHDNLFVLGDDPALYVILDQNPPWTITAYNTSPISDQLRIVNWLAKHRPHVVVLDNATPSYDTVPSDVRIPLVYQAILEKYRPVEQVGSYEVLTPLRSGQPAVGAFWSAALGTQVNLGFIPDAMRPSVPAYRSGTTEDVPYLNVVRTGSLTGHTAELVDVPVRFGAVTVQVIFEAQPRRREFSIPLSRIWAWPLSHQPTLAGNASVGWRAGILLAPLPADQLY